MQILGVLVAAFIMAPVLVVLHQGSLNAGTGGIGGRDLPAPQAGLFASLANGFFGDGSLPWNMVAIGAAIGVALLVADFALARAGARFRLHVMPVAVGIYLPLGLSAPIFMGGVLNALVKRRSGASHEKAMKRGVLLASGLIAGESLTGVAVGLLAYFGITSLGWADAILERLTWSPEIGRLVTEGVSAAALLAVMAWIYRGSLRRG